MRRLRGPERWAVALGGHGVARSLAQSPVYMGRFKPCRLWCEVGILRKDASLPLEGEIILKSVIVGKNA